MPFTLRSIHDVEIYFLDEEEERILFLSQSIPLVCAFYCGIETIDIDNDQ